MVSENVESNGAVSIHERYAQFTNVRCFECGEGVLVDELWAHDLKGQLKHYEQFALAAPCGYLGAQKTNLRPLPRATPPNTFFWVPFPKMESVFRGMLAMPMALVRTWKLVAWAQIVHVGVSGWPIPLCWLAAPVARLRRRFLVVVIESPPWFVPSDTWVPWKERARNALYHWAARRIGRMGDVVFCTQREYAAQFGQASGFKCCILPATWITEEVICSTEEADASWKAKLADKIPIVAYVGRLTASKGIPVLMQAMEMLEAQGCRIRLDVWGNGDLVADCQRWTNIPRCGVEIRYRGTLPYDATFFRQLRDYVAVIVPSISDEQPRIVFDAYSQAVPIIASATPGLRECVVDSETGLLVKVGDPIALAEALQRCTTDKDLFRHWGMNGLTESRQYTHAAMHRIRASVIADMIKQRGVA
jgi:glycosyltransferase involved in cell wall biosynthesis